MKLALLLALVPYVFATRIRRETGTNAVEVFAGSEASSFSTSNYPLPYDDNTDCSWLIRALDGEKVRLRFDSIDTEGCCDYITIYDGDSAESPVLATLRGDLPEAASYVSTFQEFFVTFHSDDSVTAQGFNATYRSVSVEQFELEADDVIQNLTSFNYPGDYPADAVQCWSISAPVDEQVKILFQNISTELCCDQIVLYDMDKPPRLVTVLKGTYNRMRAPYISSSGRFLLCFSSDDKVQMSGFSAIYRAITPNLPPKRPTPLPIGACGGNLTVPATGHAEFRSPTTWRRYANNLHCTWVVRTDQPDQKIRLWFPYIHTEECCDWIIVRDGPDGDSPKLGTVSGSPFGFHPFTSSGDAIRVDFISDYVNVGRGFRAVYEIDKDDSGASSCGENNLIATAQPQYFSSSNWPNGTYNNNENCSWVIRAPAGRMVALTLLGVLTEPVFDSIKIRQGALTTSRRIVQVNGRLYIRISAIGPQGVLRLEFNTDDKGRAGGFRAVYRFVSSTQEFLNLLRQGISRK